MLNPAFKQSYALAKAIKHRKNKNAAIRKWCEVTLKAIATKI